MTEEQQTEVWRAVFGLNEEDVYKLISSGKWALEMFQEYMRLIKIEAYFEGSNSHREI
jgi:hypothetical protein